MVRSTNQFAPHYPFFFPRFLSPLPLWPKHEYRLPHPILQLKKIQKGEQYAEYEIPAANECPQHTHTTRRGIAALTLCSTELRPTKPASAKRFQNGVSKSILVTTQASVLRQTDLVRVGAGKSLSRPTSRCRRAESIVSLERGVCSSAELQVFYLLLRLKGSMSGDARDFNNIETRAVIEFFFSCKARRRRKFTSFREKH